MKPMQIDGGENIAHSGRGYVEPGEDLNSLLGQSRIEFEFSCGRDEVLLKHLKRYHSGPLAEVILQKIESLHLFRGVSWIVRIDENVCIEKYS